MEDTGRYSEVWDHVLLVNCDATGVMLLLMRFLAGLLLVYSLVLLFYTGYVSCNRNTCVSADFKYYASFLRFVDIKSFLPPDQ